MESYGLKGRPPSLDLFASLLNIMKKHPSDTHAMENCIYIILKNCTIFALDDSISQQRSQILKLLIQYLKTNKASLHRLETIFEILYIVYACVGDRTKMNRSPESRSAVTFLLATMCSRDISKRWLAAYSMQFSGNFDLPPVVTKDDPSFMDLMNLAMFAGLPSEMVERLGVYESRSELKLSLETWKIRTWALHQISEHGDFYDVGLKLADLILRGARFAEFSRECLPEVELPSLTDGVTMERLDNFFDIIPYCVVWLGQVSEDDRHLEAIEIILMCWSWGSPKADRRLIKGFADKAIGRNPSQPFYYITLAQVSVDNFDFEEGLRVARKGLRLCDKKTSEFVKHSLRYFAGRCAMMIGIMIMREVIKELMYTDEEERSRTWGQAVAFWTSALEYFEVIVKTASPDSRFIKYAFCWYVSLLYALKGDQVDDKEMEVC